MFRCLQFGEQLIEDNIKFKLDFEDGKIIVHILGLCVAQSIATLKFFVVIIFRMEIIIITLNKLKKNQSNSVCSNFKKIISMKTKHGPYVIGLSSTAAVVVKIQPLHVKLQLQVLDYFLLQIIETFQTSHFIKVVYHCINKK